MTTPAEKTCQELKKLGIDNVEDYLHESFNIMGKIRATSKMFEEEEIFKVGHGVNAVVGLLRENLLGKKKLFIIGNGGSAAIAMHALADYSNAGGLRTMDLMSPALITCLANDYGYENVFAKHIEVFAQKDDILFAVSSSGQSLNIIRACATAKHKGCFTVTFSGFDPKNPLRKMGDINFYVPSNHYGFVELAHQTLLHCILDFYLKKRIEEEF